MLNLNNEIIQCQKCPNYKDMPCGPVLGFGNSKIMIVGECPGEEESLIGQPFIGRCGKFLDKTILEKSGIDRKDLYITNIQKCSQREGKRNVPAQQIDVCIEWLYKEIEIIKPKVIVTLGKLSTLKLLNLKQSYTLKNLVGKTFKYKEIPVMPCYHPSYLMQYQKGIDESIEVFKKIKEYM